VALAVYGSFFFERHGLRSMEFPLFLFAIASTIWYREIGPALLAVALAAPSFAYWFAEPRYSFSVNLPHLPYFVAFLLFSGMFTVFGVVRRHAEREILRSRDQLQMEVAERKEREERIQKLNFQLERRTAELEVSNGELEAFAYSISHDLRAPLRHMVGFTELLQRNAQSSLDEKSRRYTGIILDSAKRMGELIDDLLAFSRVGRGEMHQITVSLRELLKEVVEELRPETAERKISWKFGELPDLHGDASLLRLVLANLVGNAVKFTRTRPRAEIEVGSFEDGRGVVVFVKDNGVGFDMKYSNKLFRVFQRLHRREEFEGTGIGLATVQRIIHRQGGSVWAEGAVDGGAKFSFSVPRASLR
jgi:Bacteriophytochrome (light-regulated signal transduction histidine kinase)